MSLAELEPEYGVWSIEGLPLRIEYLVPVLEEISAIAVDGLYRFRHGGMEVGGVLFGTVQRGVVRVSAFRVLDCEHAFGPRFVLSERDKTAMRQLLELPRTEPSLAGLLPVGWYHSHTRSGIALSPRDLEIYDRYFPEQWQVALCVRPEAFGPARAGFFVRERNGVIHAEASYEEFAVKPRRKRPAPQEIPATPAPERAKPELVLPPEPAVVTEPVQQEPAASAPDDLPAPTFGGLAPPPSSQPVAEPAPPAAEASPDSIALPSFASAAPKQGHSRRWIWVAVAILLTIGGGVGLQVWYQYSGRPQPLSLWVADVGGQLLIEWDRTARPIQSAKGATLDITDGKEHVQMQLDGDRLREGSVDYVRSAEIVDVRFTVHGVRSRDQVESIRFIGQHVRRPEESELLRERDTLKAEVEKLRAEIQKRDALLRRGKGGAAKR